MGANVSVTSSPRFSGRVLGAIAVVVVALLVLAAWLMISASHVLDRTTTTLTNADGSKASTSTTQYAAAGFAVTSLIVLGALIMLAGVVLALSELVIVDSGTGTSEGSQGAESFSPIDAGDVSSIVQALAALAKGLGEAIKGLKASGVAMLLGAVVMIFGGIVAWQTVPGTHANPTSTITTPSEAPVGSGASSAAPAPGASS